MKNFIPLLITILLLSACSPPSEEAALKSRIGVLEQQLRNSYKPGLGEFMSGIQLHHAKLWFAGQNENWPLAGFEIGEIKESLEDISKFNTDRDEVKSLPMINPALDSLGAAIQQRNAGRFRKSFEFLTNTCNNCHKATNHSFNVITIPTTPPVSNQNFKGNEPK